MRVSLLIAGALMVLLAVAHSWLGERYILIRLFRRQDLPKLFGGTEFTKRTLRFAWHITSVFALGFAALLWLLPSWSGDVARGSAVIVAATSFACGVVALVGSRGRHLSWIVFFAVAALVWFG
ncbi:MAG TPA: hypothetical protein VLU46_02415 [Thermoanaerobaculia bacterium]|nr:hypothetical protein [Thermoanaerobaculia bacterium]